MQEAGLFRMWRPRAYGGLEVEPTTAFRVVEEIARFDSVAAWNLQISMGGDIFLTWLPEAGAAEILSHPHVTIAGSLNPPGTAVVEDGGYRVRGRWPFLSGVHQATYCVVSATVIEHGEPVRNEQGRPIQLFVWIPQREGAIPDSWHTLGMRGTGSHDFEVQDVFVPQHRTAPMAPLERWTQAYTGTLYRLSMWPVIALLALPPLGTARAAIDDLLELARAKTPSYTQASLAHRQVVQRQVAEAEATLGAGRAYLYETFRDIWEMAVAGGEIDLAQKLRIQLATTHAVCAAAQAIDLVHAAAGTSAIRNEYRFQQYFRNVHTMTQHAFVSASRYESVGALMLGVESDWALFAF
jgi:alkylation response protein AidB-like acyl-CoA dehydrogenase